MEALLVAIAVLWGAIAGLPGAFLGVFGLLISVPACAITLFLWQTGRLERRA